MGRHQRNWANFLDWVWPSFCEEKIRLLHVEKILKHSGFERNLGGGSPRNEANPLSREKYQLSNIGFLLFHEYIARDKIDILKKRHSMPLHYIFSLSVIFMRRSLFSRSSLSLSLYLSLSLSLSFSRCNFPPYLTNPTSEGRRHLFAWQIQSGFWGFFFADLLPFSLAMSCLLK